MMKMLKVIIAKRAEQELHPNFKKLQNFLIISLFKLKALKAEAVTHHNIAFVNEGGASR